LKKKKVTGVQHTICDACLFYAFDVKNTKEGELFLLRKTTSGVNIQYS
jgi:hypothetical protein